ncbi:hypothetical protein MGYG_04017 [Nannizzia gypsea CBS 118893]|uniref:Uncharacterized protein n=1 Tax=Arthroderma gypseum (strain ATCC MYA-4604 / CBS 118893) TaxID=535722 RepID=E4UUP8_ARTGP|nr:hypothetical protein MGYG_04017 [Nannizzia gypsea CBS 118893]EFR01015.1 hypothetical protein MGYG_04017 [Nannizzia gypsea CBS 118893]
MVETMESNLVLLVLLSVTLILVIFTGLIAMYYGIKCIIALTGNTSDRREQGAMIPLSNFPPSGPTPEQRPSQIGGEHSGDTPKDTKGASNEPRRSSVGGTLSLHHPLPAPPAGAIRISGLVRQGTPAIPVRVSEASGRVSPVDFTSTNRMARWV